MVCENTTRRPLRGVVMKGLYPNIFCGMGGGGERGIFSGVIYLGKLMAPFPKIVNNFPTTCEKLHCKGELYRCSR